MAPYLKDKLNFYLEKMLAGVRENFRGRVTYSPSDGTRTYVKWRELGFDIVAPMMYYSKKWETRSTILESIRELQTNGLPLYIAEFGCAPYEGASLYGGAAGSYYSGQKVSEEEQAQSIEEHVELFETGRVDGIFLTYILERLNEDNGGWMGMGILKYNEDKPSRRRLGFYAYKSYVIG
jgi:hypothetical protein